jgi:cysteine desulfurase
MKAYLDNAATTMTAPEVLKAMEPYFLQEYGNPASLHTMGQKAKESVEKARASIARVINAEPEDIVFTSGGTEADNLAIKGIKTKHIITSKVEHPAVLQACAALEKQGSKITYLDVDQEGSVNLEQLRAEIVESTGLVTIMAANNEIGTIMPLEEIGGICKAKGVPFHTDAVQGLGKMPIDVKAMNISMLSASAHKLHGPKGIGFLFVKKGIKLEPLIHGGGHERGMRSGTANPPGIIGMAKALQLMQNQNNMAELRDLLIRGLLQIPGSRLNGPKASRLCNNVNVAFKHIEGESILLLLDQAGISVSTGSACSSLSLKPSHVLLSIGLRPEDSHGSIRYSLSRYTTKEEIEYTIMHTKRVVEQLRRLSPFKEE